MYMASASVSAPLALALALMGLEAQSENVPRNKAMRRKRERLEEEV